MVHVLEKYFCLENKESNRKCVPYMVATVSLSNI